MPDSLDHLDLAVRRVISEIEGRDQGWEPLLVAIAGPPGSGKSTLAGAVRAACTWSAATVPMDGFHLSNRQLAEQGLAQIKGAPETFDREGLIAALERLGTSSPVYFPDFSHERHEPIAASIRIDPETELVVVEGNYLLLDRSGWRELAEMFDVTVFLDTPWHTCRARLVPRHEWSGKTPDSAREWVDRSDKANYDLIMSARVPADIVIGDQAVA